MHTILILRKTGLKIKSQQCFSFSLSLLQALTPFPLLFFLLTHSSSSPFTLFPAFLTSCKLLCPVLRCRSFPTRGVSLRGIKDWDDQVVGQWTALRSDMQVLRSHTCNRGMHYKLKARGMNQQIGPL